MRRLWATRIKVGRALEAGRRAWVPRAMISKSWLPEIKIIGIEGTRWCTSYTLPGSPFNSSVCNCKRENPNQQEAISEIDYYERADSTMVDLLDSLDELCEKTQTDKMDISFSDGVLNLSLGEQGIYVINKQPPNRQIWLSSPVRLVPQQFCSSRPNTIVTHPFEKKVDHSDSTSLAQVNGCVEEQTLPWRRC